MRIALAISALLVGVSASLALAASPLAYTTPKAMSAKIVGPTPQVELGNAHVPSTITATTCTGLGAAHAGKYNTFRCKAKYLNGQKTAIIWARARPGGQFCASSTGLESCPVAAPTTGDPRVCSNAPAPPTADPNRCADGAAIGALVSAEKVQFATPTFAVMNLTCTGKDLSWTCVFSTSASYQIYHATITFAQSTKGAWSATVVERDTCTVLPGAPVSGSRWTSGPTPTCTAG